MSQLSPEEKKRNGFIVYRTLYPYAKEGPGVCYSVACAQNTNTDDYRAGRLTGHQLLDLLKWKVSHSNDGERRQREYAKCNVGQAHI
ncbi:hypothetical protein B0H14DRAFT_3533376 [Mycena olivaceomarginata]|nr:hypothetical protein B0H14DRAFT_3533376 [Mycena olivaceomarginata]